MSCGCGECWNGWRAVEVWVANGVQQFPSREQAELKAPGAAIRPSTARARCPVWLSDLPARLRGAGAPEEHVRCNPESFAKGWPGGVLGFSQEIVPANRWPSQEVHTVTIVGNVGAGKTYLATALLATQILAGKSCRWVDAADLLAEAKAAFGREDVSDPVDIAAQHPGPVLLDDVNAEFRTEWARGEVSRFLRNRMGRRVPTATTMSITLADIAAVNAGLASRLGAQLVVDFGDSPDRRQGA